MWPFKTTVSRLTKKEREDLYHSIVRQARQTAFYADYGVKDTEDGRFDALVLFLVLVFIRLEEGATDLERNMIREIQEAFVTDMDGSLRELGAGDLGVARRVKFMMGALAGRKAAYKAALRMRDNDELEAALQKNLYRGGGKECDVQWFARYTRLCCDHLNAQRLVDLKSGKLEFPDIMR